MGKGSQVSQFLLCCTLCQREKKKSLSNSAARELYPPKMPIRTLRVTQVFNLLEVAKFKKVLPSVESQWRALKRTVDIRP